MAGRPMIYTPTDVPPRVALADLQADIDQLTRPIPRPPQPQRHRRGGHRRRGWTELAPLDPLLDQLRDAANHQTAIRGPERHAVPGSRPPGNLDAMAALSVIYVAISWWHAHLHLPSPPPDSDWQHTALHHLADHAHRLDHPTLHHLTGVIHDCWRTAAHHAGLTTSELLALR